MAQYNNKDQRNLEQLLEEGFWDRLKTRGAETIGAAKGLGQRLKGAGKAIGGAVMDNDDMVKSGVADIKSSSGGRQNAKIDYLKKNITKRIDKFVADLNNDIQKLGLDIGNITFASDIQDALEGLKQGIQSTPTPEQPPQDDSVDAEPEETNADDGEVEGGYLAYVRARSERAKAAAAKRKVQTNPKKGKSKDITKTYSKDFVRESYDKLFWD